MSNPQATQQQRTRTINPEFQTHALNNPGQQKADEVSSWYDNLLNQIKEIVPSSPENGRELALAKTHLEQSCFYTRKALAKMPENQL